MWTTKEDSSALSTEQKISVLQQYFELVSDGDVVFTGGEPFKKHEELFILSEYCRDKNRTTVTNTNGTYIEEIGHHVVLKRGPDQLVFSIDHFENHLHDKNRGVPGVHGQAVSSISQLLQIRKERNLSQKIYISAILMESNVNRIKSLIKYAKHLGVDGITLQALEPTFWLNSSRDRFYSNNWFKSRLVAIEKMDYLIEKFGKDPFLLLDNNGLVNIQRYIGNRDTLPIGVCKSHEHNIFIDSYGNIQLCAYMASAVTGHPLGNVKKSTLSEIINSKITDHAILSMSKCTLPCGLLNCHGA